MALRRVKIKDKATPLYDGKGAGTKDTKVKIQATGPIYIGMEEDVNKDNGWLLDDDNFDFTPTAEHQKLWGWAADETEVSVWEMGPGT